MAENRTLRGYENWYMKGSEKLSYKPCYFWGGGRGVFLPLKEALSVFWLIIKWNENSNMYEGIGRVLFIL